MKHPTLSLSLLTTSILASNAVNADALIGPNLATALSNQAGPYEVIITGTESETLNSSIQALAIPYLSLKTLPMVAASLTKTQIEALEKKPNVKSLYQNLPLEYSNYTSGEITGGHFVQDFLNVTGRGVTVAVLDSGVDATHPDLPLRDKTSENVKIVGDLDLAGGINTFIEGVPNSDTSSGHGTHVAGTVAGTGQASAGDPRRPYYHDGIAPDAKIVGLGAGEGISILYGLLGFDYAIANQERLDIDIITNSWGGGDGGAFDPNNPINVASFEAYRKGMVVSFAASNSGPDDNTLNQYAIAPWVINVAAGTSDKLLADFSSRGVEGDELKLPDITAPGQGIMSTRAPNTAIGAMGPVLDLSNPTYALHYHTISGTSMATPFIAGVAALLLEKNPSLSPDQVEAIIKETAEPMPGFKPHQVGTGYVDVKKAVELAGQVEGKMGTFLTGDTLWSSQGNWTRVDSNDPRLSYSGDWQKMSFGNTQMDTVSKSVSATINGDRVRFSIATSRAQAAAVELYVDGEYFETATVYDKNASSNDPKLVSIAFDDFGDGTHNIELKLDKGFLALDHIDVDGTVLNSDATFSSRTQNDTGLMGPSVENLTVQNIPLEISANDIEVVSSLSWDGIADLDFYLVAPDGSEIAFSASLDNPEVITFSPKEAGTYFLRVTGFISLATAYNIKTDITSASN